jgi:hypothetical protein
MPPKAKRQRGDENSWDAPDRFNCWEGNTGWADIDDDETGELTPSESGIKYVCYGWDKLEVALM